jgi:hypothetical protein
LVVFFFFSDFSDLIFFFRLTGNDDDILVGLPLKNHENALLFIHANGNLYSCWDYVLNVSLPCGVNTTGVFADGDVLLLNDGLALLIEEDRSVGNEPFPLYARLLNVTYDPPNSPRLLPDRVYLGLDLDEVRFTLFLVFLSFISLSKV